MEEALDTAAVGAAGPSGAAERAVPGKSGVGSVSAEGPKETARQAGADTAHNAANGDTARTEADPQGGNGTDDADGTDGAEVAAWLRFFEAFPDRTEEKDIPAEVFAAAARGGDPALAMMRLENGALRERIAALEAQAKAAERSPGSLAGTAAPPADPVLAAILGL